MSLPQPKKIKIYTLGGSIDKNYSMEESDFVVDFPKVDAILKQANTTIPYEIEEVLRKDSLEISATDRQSLVKKILAESCKHIIITHGTDTMHLTGQTLSSIKDKVIVITGAMRPASFKNTDAEFNIGAAFIAVQTLPPGVYMVMNGKIFDPTRVHKNFEIKAFEEKLT